MTIRRIVAGFDWRPRRNTALDDLARLADEMQADLVGLFVEDIDLLRLAALPFAREVGYPSAVRRELNASRMARAFDVLAGDLRRACESALKDTPVNWSFRVVRGRDAGELLSVAIGDGIPTLLVPPGVDPRAEPAVVSLANFAEEKSRTILEGMQRPILILP
jgi:hypothetical protein